MKNSSYKNLYRSTGKLVDLERAKIRETLRERKNIKDLKPEEEELLLKTALEKAISYGEYAKLVR